MVFHLDLSILYLILSVASSKSNFGYLKCQHLPCHPWRHVIGDVIWWDQARWVTLFLWFPNWRWWNRSLTSWRPPAKSKIISCWVNFLRSRCRSRSRCFTRRFWRCRWRRFQFWFWHSKDEIQINYKNIFNFWTVTVSKHFQVSVRRAGEWVTRDMDFRRAQQQNNFQFVSPLLDNLMFRDLQIFLLQIHHLHKYFLLYHNHQFHELIRFLLKIRK